MSRRHRAPVLVFFAMAVVCTVVLAYSIRGSAADGVPVADPGLRVVASGPTFALGLADAETGTVTPPSGTDTAALPRVAVDYVRATKLAKAVKAAEKDKSDRPGRGLGRTSATHPGRGSGLHKAHPGKAKAKPGEASTHARSGYVPGQAKGHGKAKRGKGPAKRFSRR